MTVNDYRKKHKRCKTCIHACTKYTTSIGRNTYKWECKAKGFEISGCLAYAGNKGRFCRVYMPKEFERLNAND